MHTIFIREAGTKREWEEFESYLSEDDAQDRFVDLNLRESSYRKLGGKLIFEYTIHHQD